MPTSRARLSSAGLLASRLAICCFSRAASPRAIAFSGANSVTGMSARAELGHLLRRDAPLGAQGFRLLLCFGQRLVRPQDLLERLAGDVERCDRLVQEVALDQFADPLAFLDRLVGRIAERDHGADLGRAGPLRD